MRPSPGSNRGRRRYGGWVRQVDVIAVDVEMVTGDPVVLLREQDEPHRVLPIFVGKNEAIAIALGLSGDVPREPPSTHDLLLDLVEQLDASVEHVEVTDVQDGTFVADLALRSPAGELHMDSRPSDAIALATRVNAPLFVDDDVLATSGGELTVDAEGSHVILSTGTSAGDDDTIDDEVRRFREFLAEVEPNEFDDPS